MARIEDMIQQNKKKLLKRGPGGQLTEEAPEEIQTLAGKAGLQAPPITAVGGGLLGANNNQLKMQGTPAQKQGALQLSQAPVEEGLAAAQRRGQVRDQATAAEQASQEKSENLKALGGLGDRVKGFIDKQRENLAQSTQPLEVQVAQAFEGKDLSSIKPMLDALRSNPNDMQAMLEVNKALGYDIKTQLSPDQINSLYEGAVSTISRGGAGNVDDDLTVSDLVEQPDFGYDIPTLSDLLGVAPEQVGQMSIGQIRAQVDKLANEEFSKSAQAQQQATSGQLGAAERGMARQAGREFSRVGVRSTEADVQNLEQQISNADEVSFGGKSYKVDDLLKDDVISGIISDYLSLDPGSEERKRIDETEPGLKQFIEKNQALLQDAAEQLSGGAGEFQSIQQTNQALQDFGGVKLSESLARAAIPGFGELQAERVDPSSVPLLAHIQGKPEAAAKIASELNAEMTQTPGFDEEVKDLTAEDWAKLNIEGNGQSWQNYKRIQEQARAAASTDNPDQIIAQMFSDAAGLKDVESKVKQSYFMDVIGAKGGAKGNKTALIDRNKDGKVDVDELKQYNLELNKGMGLKESLDKNAAPYQRQAMGNVYMDSLTTSLNKKIGKYITDDGYFDSKEIQKADLNWEEMQFLDKNTPLTNITEGVLSRKIEQWQERIANEYIGKNQAKLKKTKDGFTYTSPPVWKVIDALEFSLKQEGPQIDKKLIKDYIFRYKALEKAGYPTEADYRNALLGQHGPDQVALTVPDFEYGNSSEGKRQRRADEQAFNKSQQDAIQAGKDQPDYNGAVPEGVVTTEEPKKKKKRK